MKAINNSEKTDRLLLLNLIKNDNVYIDETLELFIMKQRKKIIKEHEAHHSIWQRSSDNRWCTKLGSEKRLVVRKNRSDVENAIVEHYLEINHLNVTFDNVFYSMLKFMTETHSHQPKTVNEYEFEYNRFIAYNSFADKIIAEITERDVADLLIAIVNSENGISHKRFGSVKTILRSTFNHARLIMHIDCITVKNIIADIRFPSSKFTDNKLTSDTQVFKLSEIKAIKEHLADTSDLKELGILLTMETGLRIGELATLKHSDIQNKKLQIRRSEHKARIDGVFTYYVDLPKKNKFRDVRLSNDALQILKRITALKKSEWLFPSEKNPDEWDRTYNFDKTIRRVCREIGIPVRSLHKLRKTYCSILLRQKVQPLDVMEQLGHSDFSTTLNHYNYNVADDEEKDDVFTNFKTC